MGLFALTNLVDMTGLSFQSVFGGGLDRFVFFAGSPSAARSVLSSIAAGWGTILGVVFSVTLVTVQLTANNYVPQVLTEFERDKTTQAVLGAYVGSITYALLVLKTVRTGEGGQVVFTPTLGTNVAILWAVLDLLLLVLYIANLLSFVRPFRFIQSTVQSTVAALGALGAPHAAPWIEPADPYSWQPTGRDLPRREVRAPRDGIVVRLYWKDLLAALRRHARRWLEAQEAAEGTAWHLRAEKGTGERVMEGDVMAVIEAPLAARRLDEIVTWVQIAYDIGRERRPVEDAEYGVILLEAMGVKACTDGSPQVAVECVNGLFAVLLRVLAAPRVATRLQGEIDGVIVRVERPPVDLFATTMVAFRRVMDAAVSRQLDAVPREMGTGLAALLLRMGREGSSEKMRRLLDAFMPLYRLAMTQLQVHDTLQAMAGQLEGVAQEALAEGRAVEAQWLREALQDLETAAPPAVASRIRKVPAAEVERV